MRSVSVPMSFPVLVGEKRGKMAARDLDPDAVSLQENVSGCPEVDLVLVDLPQFTQGKIERYFRSMKNRILLDLYYSPSELTGRIKEWVDSYNNYRYHEAIDDVTPSDKYYGRDLEILESREKGKAETMKIRRKFYRGTALIERPN